MKGAAGFFEDDNGKNSPIRWISFTTLIAAIVFGGLTFSMESKQAGTNITYSLLAAAFVPKVAKKFSISKGD